MKILFRSRVLPSCVILFLAGATVAASADRADEEPTPIEGDADALAALVDQLRGAESAPPESGSFEFFCHYKASGSGAGGQEQKAVTRSVARGTVRWSGSSVRWDYLYDHAGTQHPDGDRPVEPRERLVLIRTADGVIRWQPEDGIIAVRQVDGTKGFPPTALQVRPHDGWFRVNRESRRSWADMLDPEGPIPLTKIVAERDSSILTATLHYPEGFTFVITGDLSLGAVTGYEAKGHVEDRRNEGVLKWVRSDDGAVYPTTLHREYRHGRDDGYLSEWTWHLEVSNYFASLEPEPDLFEVAGIDAPADTVVRYYNSEGRLVQSGPLAAPRSPDEAADALIDRLAGENAAEALAGDGEDRDE